MRKKNCIPSVKPVIQIKKKKSKNKKIKKERGGFLNLLFAGRNEPSE